MQRSVSNSDKMTTHAIFDFGGTIASIDSANELYEQVLRAIGKPYTMSKGLT